jgi:hypothetical protein
LAAEAAKRVQLNLVIQDLDRRLTDTHRGFGTLRQVLIDTIGEDGLLNIMHQVEEGCPGFSAMLHPPIHAPAHANTSSGSNRSSSAAIYNPNYPSTVNSAGSSKREKERGGINVPFYSMPGPSIGSAKSFRGLAGSADERFGLIDSHVNIGLTSSKEKLIDKTIFGK